MNFKIIVPVVLAIITIVEIVLAKELYASIGLWTIYGIYRDSTDPK